MSYYLSIGMDKDETGGGLGAALCETPIWDSSLFWISDHPIFTYCFRHLLLIVIPCSILWLFFLFDIAYRWKCGRQHSCGPCPWTLLGIFKQISTSFLIILTIAEGCCLLTFDKKLEIDYRVEYISVCIRLITYVLALYLQIRQRRRGRLSSLKLAFFWTIMAACGFVASPFYDLIMNDLSGQTDEVLFVMSICSLCLLTAEALLSYFTDPQYNALFTDSKTDEYLVDHQAPLSRLLFSWMNRLMMYGYKNILTPEDLDTLKPDARTACVCSQLLNSWEREEQIARKAKEKKLRWWQRQPSLCLSLFRVMMPWLLPGVLLEFLYEFVSLTPAIILDWLITYLGDSNEPQWHGPWYAILLFAATVLASQMMAHSQNFIVRASVMPRAGLYAAVYRKVFRLSLESRRCYSLGELCNFLSVDSQLIFKLIWSFNMLWSTPLAILLTMALLWKYLGVASLAGLGATVVLIPATSMIAVRTHKLQKKLMVWKDSRLRQMNEILNGIKVLKLFAWEPPFIERVEEVRTLETNNLRKLAILNGLIVSVSMLTPFLVALCSFLTFVLMDEHNVLTPSIAFVSLTLFGKLRGAMSPIGQIVTEVVQSRIAFQRLAKFLLSEELDSSELNKIHSLENVLELEKASFSWSTGGEPFLQDLTLTVKRGDLVAVVGRVGAGKSALLTAILGEMTRCGGDLRLQKELRKAYVPQTAWIQNTSLRQNILFVNPMDKRKYDSVIKRCCLGPDLRILPGRDHTEIGEKGINLSGGQKQRVSLARAVYHDADFYLLDDPLSAVDAHVSKDLFNDVIGPKGTLAHKTRILVTHDLSILPHCDVIVLMSEGRIVESGSYQQLLSKHDSELTRLVNEFTKERETETEASTPSPDPSSLTTEELKAQMRRLGRHLSRTPSVEKDKPSFKNTRLIENERMEVGRVKAGVFYSYFRSSGLALTSLMFFFFTAYQTVEIGSNLWLSKWSEDVPLPDGSQNIPLRNLRLGVYGGLGFVQSAFVLLGTSLLAIASARASIRLHNSLLWSVLRSPLRFFEITPIGRILNRFGKDIQSVDTEIPPGLNSVVTAVVAVAGTLVVICANYPFFVLILVPIALLYVFMQIFYIATSRQLRRLLSVTLSPVLSFFSETVQGASVVRAYGCQSLFIRQQDKLTDTNVNVFLNTTFVNRWLGVRLQLMGAVIVLGVALLAVFKRFEYSAALAGLTLAYTLNITDRLGFLVRQLTQLETRMVSVERIDEYSRLEEEAPWSTDRCHLTLSDWPSEGSIVFKGYKMRYRSDCDYVLKGIDLEIPAEQKVGVVGRTGAGKTTLAMALFRIVEPSDGYLLIDGIDVATLGLHHLRSKITAIPQDPVLFNGDLRLNLDPTNRRTDQEVLKALEMAHLKIPADGLNMKLDEGGENLSLGQRQQVCLARALLQRSRILVLDEATAAVDLETDRLIQETIRKEFQHCTIITVAHRLHTVLDYDRILVIDDGRIVEDGPPDVLLKRQHSQFRELAHAAGLL